MTDTTGDKSMLAKATPRLRVWLDPEKRMAKWNLFEQRVKATEKGMEALAKKHLQEQQEKILEIVREMTAVTMWRDLPLASLIPTGAQRFKDITSPWYYESLQEAMAYGILATEGALERRKAGMPQTQNLFTPRTEAELLDMILYSGTKISDTLMAEVYVALEIAERENWSVEDTTQYLAEAMGDKTIWKSRRIARTEDVKVQNWGELEGYKVAEFINAKGWLCAFVELSRHDHKVADAKYSDNPIPLDDPFIVGGERLQHPGDRAGTPKQIVNCLCTMFPEVMSL